MSLRDVINQVRADRGSEEDWLLIKGAASDLNLQTDAVLCRVDIDEDHDFEEIIPQEYVERGLWSTIDYQTLGECVRWADRLAGGPSDEAACDVIRYYIRFDAPPESLGAPDPPPTEEIIARLDRKFYDSLGPEREGTECRREGCSRGAVQFSVFCKIHHFESVERKPCPFSH